MHGLFAKAAVNGVTELLPLIADTAALPDGSRALLEALHGAAVQLMRHRPAGEALCFLAGSACVRACVRAVSAQQQQQQQQQQQRACAVVRDFSCAVWAHIASV
jgi:hypothetical protein